MKTASKILLSTLTFVFALAAHAATDTSEDLSVKDYCHLGGICVISCGSKVTMADFLRYNPEDGHLEPVIHGDDPGSISDFTEEAARRLNGINITYGQKYRAALKAVAKVKHLEEGKHLLPGVQKLKHSSCTKEVLAVYNPGSKTFTRNESLYSSLPPKSKAGALSHMALVKVVMDKLNDTGQPLSYDVLVQAQQINRRLFYDDKDDAHRVSYTGDAAFTHTARTKVLTQLAKIAL